MTHVADFIVKHKKPIVIIFIAAALICGLLSGFVSVNYKMTDYLPDNVQSTKALDIMSNEFSNSVPNVRVMMPVKSISEAIAFKKKLQAVEGVSEVLWLDSIENLKKPIEMMDPEVVNAYYKDGKALYNVTVEDGMEGDTVKSLYQLVGDRGALSGDAVNIATAQQMATSETLNAVLILIPIIVIILVLTTTSWLEPIFFLMAIGISVLINMGTNIFLGEISYITQAVSPILQLAVSLDYAIFLLHKFASFRLETGDVELAMRKAIVRAFMSIAASAATTLFGFLALLFMHFRIGPDLGLNLAKGILFSFISVIVFLPALTLCLYKWIDKTKHRRLLPDFKGVGNLSIRLRIPALIIIAAIIIPSFLAQHKVAYTYGIGEIAAESRAGIDTKAINEEFGKNNIIVLLVPRGDIAKELNLSQELEKTPHITSVTSYATTVGNTIPADFIDQSITKEFYSKDYARIILYTDTEEEGDIPFALIEQIKDISAKYYSEGVYSLGQSANLYDMKETITRDNKIVNLIAVLSIAAVLLISFKSITMPLILLLCIESAIWINLAIPYFTDSALCFIGFLVINTVQLGATVDYAILISDNYKEHRKQYPAKEAIRITLHRNFISLLTSASILSSAGFCLFLTSSNQIVSQLGLLLGRGTLLSLFMVVFLLPALLTIFDKLIGITTLNSHFSKGVVNNDK